MKKVADIILDQIRATDRMALFAWGTSKYMSYPATDIHNGKLSMECRNNPKHKDLVVLTIELAFNDTYTIRVIKYKKEISVLTDIYCDQLVEIIDDILG